MKHYVTLAYFVIGGRIKKGENKIKGIDVSRYQGDIDWPKVKSENIEFVIIRAGFGKFKSQKDIKFNDNYKNAKENGMKIGTYWFSYATSIEDAREEARVFSDIIKDFPMDLPVFYDYEYDSVNYGKKVGIKPSKELATNMAKAFLGEILLRGHSPGIYSNVDFLLNWFDVEKLSGYPIWLAKWTSNPDFNNPPREHGDIICWQYSSKGKINGINGNVDLNYGYFSEESNEVILVPAPVSYIVASVTASVLNVRSGPGVNHGIIRKLHKGNLIDVLESYHNGWSKINIRGLIGFVNHSYLSTYKRPLEAQKTSNLIKVGSKVKVRPESKTFDGIRLAQFVYNEVYDVIQVKNDRVVIGKGKKVTAALHTKNLILQ